MSAFLLSLLIAVPRETRAALLRDASAAQAAGNRVEATRLFSEAASRFHSVRALVQLARLQAESGNAKAGLESLQQARALAPNSEPVLLAYAELSLAARLPLAGVLALHGLTSIAPDVAQYQYLLGVGLMQLGDVPAASEALRAADRLEPDRPLTLAALGLALNARKLYSEARPLLERSLELDPDAVEAMAALAEAEVGTSDLARAEAQAQRVLQHSGRNATARLALGMVRMQQTRYEDARDELQAAIAAEPDAPRIHYQLSLALARIGDSEGSERERLMYQEKRAAAEARVAELHLKTGGGAQ
jgi:tetratricopeptide (TPR) repeat protein